jgi:hypothetical protein
MTERRPSDRGIELSDVSIFALVIGGLLLAVMIGISCYGAVSLPPDARIPLHYGIGSYNNFASKTTALVLWPAGGALIFALLTAVSVHAIKPNHPGGGAPAIITPIALAIAAATQWGAISLGKKNAASLQE